MCRFHAPDYVDFLRNVSPTNAVSEASSPVLVCVCLWVGAGARRVQSPPLPRPTPPCASAPPHPTPPTPPHTLPAPLPPPMQAQYQRELREYNMYEDCPVFDGLYNYCQVCVRAWGVGADRVQPHPCHPFRPLHTTPRLPPPAAPPPHTPRARRYTLGGRSAARSSSTTSLQMW